MRKTGIRPRVSPCQGYPGEGAETASIGPGGGGRRLSMAPVSPRILSPAWCLWESIWSSGESYHGPSSLRLPACARQPPAGGRSCGRLDARCGAPHDPMGEGSHPRQRLARIPPAAVGARVVAQSQRLVGIRNRRSARRRDRRANGRWPAAPGMEWKHPCPLRAGVGAVGGGEKRFEGAASLVPALGHRAPGVAGEAGHTPLRRCRLARERVAQRDEAR